MPAQIGTHSASTCSSLSSRQPAPTNHLSDLYNPTLYLHTLLQPCDPNPATASPSSASAFPATYSGTPSPGPSKPEHPKTPLPLKHERPQPPCLLNLRTPNLTTPCLNPIPLPPHPPHHTPTETPLSILLPAPPSPNRGTQPPTNTSYLTHVVCPSTPPCDSLSCQTTTLSNPTRSEPLFDLTTPCHPPFTCTKPTLSLHLLPPFLQNSTISYHTEHHTPLHFFRYELHTFLPLRSELQPPPPSFFQI